MPSPISTLRKSDRPVAPNQGFKEALINAALGELDHPTVEMFPTPTAGRSRTLRIAAAATLAALLVGVPALLTGVFQPETPGGSITPVDVPDTTIVVPEFATWQDWRTWRREVLGILDDPGEQCAADAGILPQVEVDGIISRPVKEGIDPDTARQQASDCIERLREKPFEWAPHFAPEELPYLYEAMLETRSCVTGLGYETPEPPTLEEFIDGLARPGDGAWSPYVGVAEVRLVFIKEACKPALGETVEIWITTGSWVSSN